MTEPVTIGPCTLYLGIALKSCADCLTNPFTAA